LFVCFSFLGVCFIVQSRLICYERACRSLLTELLALWKGKERESEGTGPIEFRLGPRRPAGGRTTPKLQSLSPASCPLQSTTLTAHPSARQPLPSPTPPSEPDRLSLRPCTPPRPCRPVGDRAGRSQDHFPFPPHLLPTPVSACGGLLVSSLRPTIRQQSVRFRRAREFEPSGREPEAGSVGLDAD